MIDLAHTSGLVRGWSDVQVPDAAEIPEMPEQAPEIPEAAPLPEAPGMEIPGGDAAAAQMPPESFLDKARLREDRRRAAQALVETAQVELQEELKEIAEKESLIEARGYDLEDVYPQEEPPPPPPSEERMWEETRERAERHGVREYVGDNMPSTDQPTQEEIEESGQNCCSYGCIAFFMVLFIFFLIGFIINVVQ
jgi:hypothetical protein